MNPFLAHQVRRSVAQLVIAAREVSSHAFWSPLEKGRTAYSQIIECGRMCEYLSDLLQTKTAPPTSWLAWETVERTNDTFEKACDYLEAKGEKLAQAVEAFPTDYWNETVAFPLKPDDTDNRFVDRVMWVVWNNHYHEGQIQYMKNLTE